MTDRGEVSLFSRHVVRALALASVALVLLLVMHFAAQELFILFAGVLFAIALHGASAWLAAHTKLPHKAAVGVLSVLLVTVGVASGGLAGPALDEQAHKLVQQLPRAYHDAIARAKREPLLEPLVAAAPGVPASGDKPAAPDKAAAPDKSAPSDTLATPQKPSPSDKPTAPEAPAPAPSTPGGVSAPAAIASGAASVLRGVSETFGAFIVIFFLGVYGAADPDAYTRPILQLVPWSKRARVAEVLRESGSNLGRWLLGRAVAMLFVGVCTSVVLVLLEVPLALGLGVLSGLLAFVEYVGAFASAIPVALMALTVGPGQVVAVLALYTFVHVIEGYVLTPLLARTAVSFPPGYTLIGQVLLGSLYGPLGITFSTPLAVVAVIGIDKLYVEDVLGERPPRATDER